MDDTVLDPLTQPSFDEPSSGAAGFSLSKSDKTLSEPSLFDPPANTAAENGEFDGAGEADGASAELVPGGGLIGEGEAIVGMAMAVKSALQSKLSPEQFQTWFQRSKLIRIDDTAATIAVPNSFAKVWIERYYLAVLEDCIAAVLGARRRVILSESPESLVNETSRGPAGGPDTGSEGQKGAGHEEDLAVDLAEDLAEDLARAAGHGSGRPVSEYRAAHSGPAESDAPATGESTSAGSGGVGFRRGSRTEPRPRRAGWNALDESSDFVLNSKCTFESFVVGPCNRFGHAASMGAAEQPGKSYNPLFLHGRVGVGKTHLLQAFCFSVLDRFPGSKILYLSCETFVNHFISALENGDTLTFRDKYRNIDVLVVDDIQILANKEKTQEEFFHTFNSLYNAGKQIVLSSDSPPKDIPTLQDRLVSRFKWGMVTEIEPPCFETRMAIVKRKSRDRGADLPDDVAQFIAENIEENVRELEGAVTRLFGYSSLNNAPMTLDLAREALAGLIERRTGAPTVDDIISLVTEHYQVRLTDLQSKRRTKAIAFPRQVAMYLVRKVTRHSLEEIGGFLGGRDHTTVLYGVEKIDNLMTEDLEFAKRVQGFLEILTR